MQVRFHSQTRHSDFKKPLVLNRNSVPGSALRAGAPQPDLAFPRAAFFAWAVSAEYWSRLRAGIVRAGFILAFTSVSRSDF